RYLPSFPTRRSSDLVNLPNPTISSPITNGSFSGSVGLPANTTGIIKVTGYLNGEIPFGNLLNNTVEISNNEITDQDLENNTSTIDRKSTRLNSSHVK